MSSARSLLSGAALLLAIALPALAQSPRERDFDFAELGTTHVHAGGQAGLVVLLADRDSSAHAAAIAGAITGGGRSAAVVDLDTYFGRVATGGADCFDASTLLDVYAQRVQQELRFPRFGTAALVGVGRGAAFLPLLLAGSRTGLFAAGVSAGAPPPLLLPAAPCGPLAGRVRWQSPRVAVTLPSGLQTTAPWAASDDIAPAAVLNALDGLLARAAPPDAPADLPLVELPQPATNAPKRTVVKTHLDRRIVAAPPCQRPGRAQVRRACGSE